MNFQVKGYCYADFYEFSCISDVLFVFLDTEDRYYELFLYCFPIFHPRPEHRIIHKWAKYKDFYSFFGWNQQLGYAVSTI